MEIRPTVDQDLDAFVETFHASLGRFPEPAIDGAGQWWSALEMERGLVAQAPDGRLIGTAAVHSLELTLPGGPLAPVAAVTAVGVLPSHRRRGTLTALVRRQFAGLRDRGDFLAVLIASEAPIYGRFGYGPATYTANLKVTRLRAGLDVPRAGAADGGGSVEVLDREECGEVLEEVYDRYRRFQPGALSRPHRWWELRAGEPPLSPAARWIAVHRDAGGAADGYASYAVDGEKLVVDEIITTEDAAFTRLARFALEHDLVSEILIKHVPPAHPLRWQFTDFRAGEVSLDTDWLWVRLLDVPRALTARGWLSDGELVLDVDDPFLGERGRHLLRVQDGKAECGPTDREPDLSLDVRDLGSIYLGGTTPSMLVRAGHIRAHHSGAATQADDLFRAERDPHCLHWF